MAERKFKVTIVGDERVGKSTFLTTLGGLPPPRMTTDYWDLEATVLDPFALTVPHGESPHPVLEFWDVRSEEGHDRLRPLYYPQTDLVIFVFSIASQQSFICLKEKWIPELWHYIPGLPALLVGTHAEARDEEYDVDEKSGQKVKTSKEEVGMKEIKKLVKEMEKLMKGYGGSVPSITYLECDAREADDLEGIGEEVCRHPGGGIVYD